MALSPDPDGRRGATADHGTSELVEVAYRFGRAVVELAVGTGPPARRLVAAWRELDRVDGALSGLWPEPRVPTDLAAQARGLLVELTADGSIEQTVAAMDPAGQARATMRIIALAFALQQATGAADPHLT